MIDSRTGERDNQGSMRVRRSIRLLAVALAAAVGWSLWTECALAAASTPNMPMACCKDGEMKCAGHGSASDCCATDASHPRAAVTAARIDPVHTLTAVVAWAVVPDLATLDSVQPLTSQPISPPRLNDGPFAYIAFSSLLI
jgi:hypothetical protein